MGEQRATIPVEKNVRRQRMLDAAERLLESWSYTDITMDRIAGETGVAKGTLYLYFRSKEELFLQLFEDRLLEWYSELEALAGLGSHTIAPADAARVIATSLGTRPSLVLLHGILHSTICSGIDLDTTVAFRRRQRTSMESLGAAFARRIHGVSEERGIHFLVQLEAVVCGLSWTAFRSSALDRAFELAELDVFHVNFEEELREIVTALLA